MDSLIIIYDAVKGIFSKKKKLSKEEQVKKLENELLWANAGFGFVLLFFLKSVLYFIGNAKGKGALSAAAAVITLWLVTYEKKKLVKQITALKGAKAYSIKPLVKVPHVGEGHTLKIKKL